MVLAVAAALIHTQVEAEQPIRLADTSPATHPAVKYRATASVETTKHIVWQGTIRDTYSDAANDAKTYKDEHPDVYVHVARTGDPDFADD